MSKPVSTIAEFCSDHGISKCFFHKIVNQGKGPRLMKIGRRTFISAEASADWRASLEQDADSTAKRGAK